MRRVELHQARYRAHATLGFYQTWRTQTQEQTPPREARYCPCGTKLRQTKSLYEPLCDTCDDKRRQEKATVGLHALNGDPHRPSRYDTCQCGNPKRITSTRCITCHLESRCHT